MNLYRNRSRRILGGVAAGIGDYVGLDPVVIRLLFVVLSLINGIGIIIYVTLWLLLPLDGTLAPDMRYRLSENVDDMQATFARLFASLRAFVGRVFSEHNRA